MGGARWERRLVARGWITAAVLAAGFLTACGSDDDGASSTAAASTTAVAGADATGTTTAASDSTATTATTTAPVVATAVDDPTTTAVAVVGLSLEPDGLGVVRFGADREATIAAIAAVIGEPTSVSEPYQDSGNTSRASAGWEGLVLTFTGPVDGPTTFWAYEFGRVHQVDASGNLTEGEPWAPTGWQAATSTAEGITVGAPMAGVAEAHPTVYLPDCGRSLRPAGLLGGAGEIGQTLFLEPMESGLFLRAATDGGVFSVGAQASPNQLACDGG